MRTEDCKLWSFQTVFFPDFREALALAVVVAEDVDRIALPQPSMELLEELPALGFGDSGIRAALGQRAKGVETIETQLI